LNDFLSGKGQQKNWFEPYETQIEKKITKTKENTSQKKKERKKKGQT